MAKSDYADYLASDHWRWMARRAKQQAGNRCQGCGLYSTAEQTIRLEVHHLTYVRVGKERWEDLAVLCEACHDAAHGVPEADRTTPGPELVGPIANRLMHFSSSRRPRQGAA